MSSGRVFETRGTRGLATVEGPTGGTSRRLW